MNYNSLNQYLRSKYGCKIYKVALDGGFSCPNRDGAISYGGCIFCSGAGSGDFTSKGDIEYQLTKGKELIAKKNNGGKYIAYFQAFTNTYGSIDVLEKTYKAAMDDDDVVALSIGTRPDCLGDDVLELLSKLNKIKPITIELGLQTIHEDTAILINRGYKLCVFEEALRKLNKRNIETVVHIIIGLPHEDKERILKTVDYVAHKDVQGIKIQLLHVLKDTKLCQMYEEGLFDVLSMEEYIHILGDIIERLPENMVIHRMTGDGNKKNLVAPLWSGDKKRVLNSINKYFMENDIVQGKKYVK